MRVLVCGGRDYANTVKMNEVLTLINTVREIKLIIHGAARGADIMAGFWAKGNDIKVAAFPAKWNVYGKSAGYVRNGQMLIEGKPDLVVAFPGGRGTADMVRQATNKGIKVVEIRRTSNG